MSDVQGSTSAAGGRGTPRGVPGAAFDAFGLRRDATNWDYDLTTAQITALKDDTDRGYTFQEQLDNVGLIHMNGRVYDPSIGRFISADPTVPDPLYSQSFNRYSYVYNSPLSRVDPSGLGPSNILGPFAPQVNNPVNMPLFWTGVGNSAKGFGIGIGGAFIFAGASTGAYPSGFTSVLAAGLGVTVMGYGSATASMGFAQIYDAFNGTNLTSMYQIPGVPAAVVEAIGDVAEAAVDPIAAALDAIASELINHMTKTPQANSTPPNNTKIPTQPQNPSGAGGPSGSSFSAGGGYDPYSGVSVSSGSSANAGTPPPTIMLAPIKVTGKSPNACMDGKGKPTTCPT